MRRKLISVGPSLCPRALSPWCKWPRGPLRHGCLTHGSGTRENQPQFGLRIRRIDICSGEELHRESCHGTSQTRLPGHLEGHLTAREGVVISHFCHTLRGCGLRGRRAVVPEGGGGRDVENGMPSHVKITARGLSNLGAGNCPEPGKYAGYCSRLSLGVHTAVHPWPLGDPVCRLNQSDRREMAHAI